jgi:hypothetical protein
MTSEGSGLVLSYPSRIRLDGLVGARAVSRSARRREPRPAQPAAVRARIGIRAQRAIGRRGAFKYRVKLWRGHGAAGGAHATVTADSEGRVARVAWRLGCRRAARQGPRTLRRVRGHVDVSVSVSVSVTCLFDVSAVTSTCPCRRVRVRDVPLRRVRGPRSVQAGRCGSCGSSQRRLREDESQRRAGSAAPRRTVAR